MRPAVLGLAFAATLAACAAAPDSKPAPFDTEADAYLSAAAEHGAFNGTVMLSRGGEVFHEGAYTVPGEVPASMPVTMASQFDMRSFSKLVAKLAVLQLESEGKIDRNAPVSRYVSGVPQGDRITIQHLMDNTSGFPREFSYLSKPSTEMSPADILWAIRGEALEFEPGTDSRYSNVGYQLLYLIIGEVTGESFVRHVEKAIFEPAGMAGAGARFYSGRDNLTAFASGHELEDGEIMEVPYTEDDGDFKTAILFATAEDIHRFLLFAASGPFAGELANDEGMIAHAGGSTGKRAWGEVDRKTLNGVVFLANYDEVAFGRMTKDLRALVDGEPYELIETVSRTAVSVPFELRKQYEGTYLFAEAGGLKLRVEATEDGLAVYQNGQLAGELQAESETVFFADPASPESFTFVRQESGEIVLLMDWQGVAWRGERL
ncbi:serine hydrolase domain-containing protein [Parvularcula maris]|uniref:Beta-lactamase family protein n=1 Tax=Parvularcula maris TaxID=2965077 RepID=A0A9X2L6E4_9PROT|nr:serine hydrolase domain-containing protein [Parvularcula maris]MCQ8183910.1 beta-lactamase family protein [Parvularcula maris]